MKPARSEIRPWGAWHLFSALFDHTHTPVGQPPTPLGMARVGILNRTLPVRTLTLRGLKRLL